MDIYKKQFNHCLKIGLVQSELTPLELEILIFDVELGKFQHLCGMELIESLDDESMNLEDSIKTIDDIVNEK